MWMTQGPRSPRAALVALGVAGVLAGCVTLTPKQEETLDDVRRFADATAAAYDVPRIRVNGMSEKDAVGTVVAHLRSAQRAVERGGPIAPGHRTPTAEIADLLARYPGNTPD